MSAPSVDTVEPDRPHLSSGTAALLSAKGLGLGLNLVTVFFLPRFLGPAAWGVYVIWLSLWGLSTQILESGVGVVMNRFLPILRAERPERVLKFQHGLLTLKLLALPGVWLVGWIILGRSDAPLVFHDVRAFTLVILSAFLYSWASLDVGLLFNYQRMLACGSFTPLNLLLRLVTIPLFFYFMGRAGIPPALFVASLLLTLLYLLWSLPLTRQLSKHGTRGVYFPIRELFQFGLWIGVGQFGLLAVARLPGLAGELMQFNKEEIGYMGLALFCYATLRVLPASILFSLLPHLVTLAHKKEHADFDRYAAEGWRYTNLCLFWMLLGLMSLAPAWFPLMLGKRYADGMPQILLLLRWTAPAMILGAWLDYFQQSVFAQGKRRAFIFGALLVLGVFPLIVFLTPEALGIRRLVIALGGSLAAGTLLMGACSGFHRGLVRFSLLPMLLFLLLTLPTRWIPPNAGLALLVFGAIQTPLYFILLQKLGVITSADRRRLGEVFERVGRTPPSSAE